MHVVVSGGTGFVGSAIVKALLARGDSVSIVSRSPASVFEKFQGKATGCQLDQLPPKFDAVINLAGANIAQRWTAAHKKTIRDSRVDSTNALRIASEARNATLLSASAVGIYGNHGDEVLDESSPLGGGFQGEVCSQWEEASRSDRIRSVQLRIGVVLGTQGGALPRMLPFFRWCLGGRLGSGQQYMSWIHVQDVVRAVLFLLDDTKLEGAFNVTSPKAVTNLEFTKALGAAVRRPTIFPVPVFVLKLLYGQMSEVVLTGQRVMPTRLTEVGFKFDFESLNSTLSGLLNKHE
ncbi:TIGR01777 family oxidoreductase [Planctomycetota bacterium]|nr:TIGR01777 family oxidoreductase [Planctomycetota bacterium]